MLTQVVSQTQLRPLYTLYVCFLAWITRHTLSFSTPTMPNPRKPNYPYNQKYTVPFARKLSPAEQTQVDYYRTLRERFHDGPFYSVLDASSSNAKKGSAARVNFDPFHGMPTYSGRYQRKRRTLPKIAGQSYYLKFFPRDLWQTLQPNFRPDASLDGYHTQASAAGVKRGFEDEEDDGPSKRKTGEDDEENEGEGEEAEALDDDEEQAEEELDDDFSEDDDDMGGDYNAEQYFDGGDDDMGDEDGGGDDDM
ncbi:unnamed protein product [Penicillium salamii]|uniref:DNA-directed RNA polymerase III subunit n=1 Tax=Penicillium salamii TaxID=1612424 RepID=A0A9W4JQT3_9EURO|nr:unnamed protein product [Penicillium salamii]